MEVRLLDSVKSRVRRPRSDGGADLPRRARGACIAVATALGAGSIHRARVTHIRASDRDRHSTGASSGATSSFDQRLPPYRETARLGRRYHLPARNLGGTILDRKRRQAPPTLKDRVVIVRAANPGPGVVAKAAGRANSVVTSTSRPAQRWLGIRRTVPMTRCTCQGYPLRTPCGEDVDPSRVASPIRERDRAAAQGR